MKKFPTKMGIISCIYVPLMLKENKCTKLWNKAWDGYFILPKSGANFRCFAIAISLGALDSRNPGDLSFSTTASSVTSYNLPGLDIEEGPFIFTYFSFFLSLITPYDVPLDLLRDAVHSNLTVVDLATKALKIESGFICIMTFFVVLCLVPLGATVAWCCRRRYAARQPEEPIDPLMTMDDSLEDVLRCRRRASVIALSIFFVILVVSDVIIFLTNSQLSSTIEMTPDVIQESIHDLGIFLKDTHVQIKRKLDNGFDIAIQNVTKDLEDIDILLGEPIRMEVSASTGIELAFDSLMVISAANLELINRILLLQDSIAKSLKISQEAAARMEELQIQLSVLQRQCTFRDRPLCDTLRIRSFDENGIIDALKTLQEDQSIFKMRYIGELEVGTTVRNLSTEVAISKSTFGNYPAQVKSDTLLQRNETIEQLDLIRQKTTTMANLLTQTITHLLDRLSGTWQTLEPHYKTLQAWCDRYWGLTWTSAMVMLWVLLFMLLTLCCNFCNSKVKAAVLLVASVCIICLGSIVIMLYGVFTLAIGGNAEVFVCQPLFDEDQYDVLTKMFDKPGLFYANEPETGIIGELLRPPGQNISIVNVSLASAIRNCEKNMASYTVFQLDAFVNTTQLSDLKNFPKVSAAIESIQVSERTFLSLTQPIQSILENMLNTADMNLTAYRSTISQPTPEKDLATFIDQMQRVALQIQDVATSSRMTTLGSRAKRLQASILQPLEQLRNEILYHLTALELQKDPWSKQVNQTLNHLRNVQGYLEKTAAEICRNETEVYIRRLKNYLTANKARVTHTLGDQTALCRPFFDIFNMNRIFLCRNAVDFVNGLWFCTFITLFLWAIGTPIALNIIDIYAKIKEVSRARISHLYGKTTYYVKQLAKLTYHKKVTTPENLLISQQSGWSAPPSAPRPPPMRMGRQDSIRSVRWETGEEMEFEDVD